MTGYRVKIENNSASPTPSIEEIIHAAAQALEGLFILDAFPTKDGAVLIVDCIEAVEGLLHEKTQAFLQTKGLKTAQPDWYMPVKTIFVYKIPHWIATKPEKEILTEVNRCNAPLKASKITIIQRKNARPNDRMSMKVEFLTEEMATVALQRGLKYYDISHRIDLMEREKSNKIAVL